METEGTVEGSWTCIGKRHRFCNLGGTHQLGPSDVLKGLEMELDTSENKEETRIGTLSACGETRPNAPGFALWFCTTAWRLGMSEFLSSQRSTVEAGRLPS